VDYTLANGTLTIAAGSTSGTITIAGIVDDLIDELDETVVVTLSAPTNATIGATPVHTYTILDNDAEPSVTLSESGSPIAENGGVSTITATLSAISALDVTIDLAYAGTATGGGVDYTASSSQIVILAGSTTGSVTITGDDDVIDETDETVLVDISGVSNGTDASVQQTIIITDDDAEPSVTLSESGSPIAEDGGVSTITATLSVLSGLDVTVDLAYTGTATGGGTDYTASSSQIVISAGSLTGSVDITGVDDALSEVDETVLVDISGVSNGTDASVQQTITITDDDMPPVITTCASDRDLNADASCNSTIPDLTSEVIATDDGAIESITQSPAAGTVVGLGVHTVTITVTDDDTNETTCNTDVTVIDLTNPTASDLAPINVECAADIPAPDIMLVSDAADNCGPPVVTWVDDVSDGNSCPEIITRTYSVTDASGNSINVIQLITVNDITAPTVVCQDITVQIGASGTVSILASQIDNGSFDNCGIESMWLDVYDFDCTHVGPNLINLFARDSCGTIASCAATVTVEDNIPPVITCPGDEMQTAVAGNCSMVVNGIAPLFSTDNCSNATISYRLEGATTGSGVDDVSGTAFNKGVTTVWYKITDPNGNADSCSFDITVLTTVVPPDSAFSNPDEVCPGDGTINLYYDGGVMVEGGIAVWYDDPAMTTSIGTGNALTLPAPLVSTTYFLRFEGICDISPAVSTTVTVRPLTVDP